MSKKIRKDESSLLKHLRSGRDWEEEWERTPIRLKSSGRRKDRETRPFIGYDRCEEEGRYAYYSKNAMRRMRRGRKPRQKKYYKKATPLSMRGCFLFGRYISCLPRVRLMWLLEDGCPISPSRVKMDSERTDPNGSRRNADMGCPPLPHYPKEDMCQSAKESETFQERRLSRKKRLSKRKSEAYIPNQRLRLGLHSLVIHLSATVQRIPILLGSASEFRP